MTPGGEPTARALLEHLRAEQAHIATILRRLLDGAPPSDELRARDAGYSQAIIDAEEWIAEQDVRHRP